MDSFWLLAYWILAAVALLQAVLLAIQTWEHRRLGRSCMRRLYHDWPSGRAAVIAPCKQLDVDLEANLAALLRQDYGDYEVTFVVESNRDPAVEVIHRVMASHPTVASRLVVAGKAVDCGQKVHNLRAATADLPPHIEHLAFVDSDAGPRPEWLRSLIARLYKPGVGAVTGYRWYVPARPSLSNHLLYSMNCDVMSLLARQSHGLVWGGSWGIRRELFDSLGLRGAWQGTLSDDIVAGRLLRRAKYRVRFEPPCIVGSPLDYAPKQMLAFVRRQYLVTRYYAPVWWAAAQVSAAVKNLAWIGSLAAVGTSLVFGTPNVWLPLGVCGLLYATSVFRGLVRKSLVKTYFPEHRPQLRSAARFDVWAGPMVAAVHWAGLLGSMFGRQIAWRGIRYELAPGGKVRRVTRHGDMNRPIPATLPYRQPAAVPVPEFSEYSRSEHGNNEYRKVG